MKRYVQSLPPVWSTVFEQPLLGLPLLIALAHGWLIDVLLRPSSSVVPGDSGELLLGRVILSSIMVVLPALVWAVALTVTAALALDVWRGNRLNWQVLVLTTRLRIVRSVQFIAILAGIQLILSILEPFASILTEILVTGVVFCCAFALPAHVVGRLSALAAFQTSLRIARDRPAYVAFTLAIPAGAILVGWFLSYLLLNIPVAGAICSAVIAAEVIAFSILYVTVVYDRGEYTEQNIAAQPLALPGARLHAEPADGTRSDGSASTTG